MDFSKYSESVGVDFKLDTGTNFTILGITVHNHLGDPENTCSYRYGVMVTVLGIGIIIGWFRNYSDI